MAGGWWFMALFYPHYLVGGIPTPLKNMKVSWDDYSQYMENKKCLKPPTSYNYVYGGK